MVLLLLFVGHFVVIMAGIILPWWVLADWWMGGDTVSMTTVVIVACISWVCAFWDWLKQLGED